MVHFFRTLIIFNLFNIFFSLFQVIYFPCLRTWPVSGEVHLYHMFSYRRIPRICNCDMTDKWHHDDFPIAMFIVDIVISFLISGICCIYWFSCFIFYVAFFSRECTYLVRYLICFIDIILSFFYIIYTCWMLFLNPPPFSKNW